MNISLPPQTGPGPVPAPAPDLAACMRGIQASIHDWAAAHPHAARIADPVTAYILALLQSLIDLFTAFADSRNHPAPYRAAPLRAAPSPRQASRAPAARRARSPRHAPPRARSASAAAPAPHPRRAPDRAIPAFRHPDAPAPHARAASPTRPVITRSFIFRAPATPSNPRLFCSDIKTS
jgi:hypothetical protein